MGLFRKTMSVSTLGMVSYRNKDERAHKVARQQRNATRALVAQQAVDLDLQRQQIAELQHLNAQAGAHRVEDALRHTNPFPPAGWLDDPDDPSQYRYWDGAHWTEHRAPKA